MTDTNTEPTVIAKWDPVLTKHVVDVMRPIVKRYFRSEVRGLENIPARGCLVVANHSGGMMTPDWPVFAVDYYDKFGYDRPLYALAHDLLFTGPADGLLKALGIIRANPANAAQALAADGVVLVFPGGDFDVYRPTMRENVIGFAGRTGYVSSAIEAGAPIVPTVFIGGQETQLYLSRGRWLSRALRLDKLERKLGRTDILPITFGFPFGLSVLLPVNMPLPTKIVGQVLPQIDIAAEFGDEPDVDRVDVHVRAVMQTALARLARQRRLPVVG
ncbi:MAG TPA: 1-acyl-sn-glycerol-3-phosphate acyltransferase [Mycobacterium sp.]|nr:1-acyl-sn-glycerol-3-phosphate acyltransferase [Mycobacterium sp.]